MGQKKYSFSQGNFEICRFTKINKLQVKIQQKSKTVNSAIKIIWQFLFSEIEGLDKIRSEKLFLHDKCWPV